MSSSSSLSTDATIDPFASLYQNQPEIWHTFPPQEKRPNTLLAFIFTLTSILPFLSLCYYLLMHTNIIKSLQFPTSSKRELITTALFQGSIGGICIVFLLYWLHLNIFQALTMMVIPSVIAVFSGVEALRALHTRTSHGIESQTHRKVE